MKFKFGDRVRFIEEAYDGFFKNTSHATIIDFDLEDGLLTYTVSIELTHLRHPIQVDSIVECALTFVEMY